jgi:hypothetical protein
MLKFGRQLLEKKKATMQTPLKEGIGGERRPKDKVNKGLHYG